MEMNFSDEPWIRVGVFLGVLAMMAVLEAALPRRRRQLSRTQRWPANLGIVLAGTLIARLLVPVPPAAAAIWASDKDFGLFPMFGFGGAVAIVAGIVVLDAAIYIQHVIFHKVPILWRLHRMHHADTEIDVTTGIRFHPIEIVLSLLIKIAIVVALGLPAEAVILFEVILNVTSMFNHANVKLPLLLDTAIRQVIVTPDMHRVHHSWRPDETNSNYGFNLSVWDRLFGTYRDQPRDGHDGMTIGLKVLRGPRDRSLIGLLAIPFRRT